MQRKHLIAFTLATIFMLLGFNFINNNRHEQSRAEVVSNAPIVAQESPSIEESDNVSINNNESIDIAEQPLGEQPKAIIDDATMQIEQAQQERLEQIDNAQ